MSFLNSRTHLCDISGDLPHRVRAHFNVASHTGHSFASLCYRCILRYVERSGHSSGGKKAEKVVGGA